MKKFIALLLILIFVFSIISCEDEVSVPHPKTKAERTTVETTAQTDPYTFPSIIAEYSIHDDLLIWKNVEHADSYVVEIDGTQGIYTTNNYVKLEGYTPGYHTAKVTPFDSNGIYKAKNVQATTFRINGFEDENAAKNKAKEELIYSIVEITIEKYNDGFLGMPTDNITQETTGVICKKNGQTYWAITYNPLIKTGRNYDHTIITVQDFYGNEYKGSIITPTTDNSGILSVISFTDPNTQKTLPVVSFSNNLPNIEHVMLVSESVIETPIITKIVDMNRATDNGLNSRYQAVITEYKSTIVPKNSAVFDEFYNLVGIAIRSTSDGKIRFLQIREVLEYIDPVEAQKYGILSKVITPGG